jgi:hypothetical protein
MKKNILYLIPVLFCIVFQGCIKDKLTRTYTIFTPIYKEKSEVYANIKSNAPREVAAPGKIFLYGNYIFLNELDKGVHIIDNSDPSHPVAKAFIDIPGNLDIAVKGNTLYADLYTDMVVVDITNPLQASYVRHINNVFPERTYVNGFYGDSSRIIVGWTKKDTTVRLGSVCNRCYYLMASSGAADMGVYTPGVGGGGVPGIAGSMARFSLVNNYLYTVNRSDLSSFNISNNQDPVKTATQHVAWNIETIYPFGNKLFLGSASGMFIYNISNPAVPVPEGQFAHLRSCDPVIADGNYAYVTLRSGTTCEGFTNQLDVINISNVLAPSLEKTYTMTNPHGLSKDNNMLFICDGAAGLKMFDATDPLNIVQKKQLTNIETYDAIAWNGNLVVVAKDGLYQYSYSFPDGLTLRSKFSVNR